MSQSTTNTCLGRQDSCENQELENEIHVDDEGQNVDPEEQLSLDTIKAKEDEEAGTMSQDYLTADLPPRLSSL
ncbi:hypothetical protein BFJ66_g17096 [Fusarium oxysporum f. sp. cepae]|uniref:Uncharacterized protein n=1 Tax=Fusarium oxysporum f. sp. cepae TaxID=396571 RepID=A0A3L6N2Q0_FUSOX|nr:hypothetical protein BFJ65_g15077 [Fusarium oxysporum f. sp. cepae]RKK26491.1 hypothetical protein BFJ66_g17096 [Fusarium oxysporum f. sp. cepae]